MVTFHPIFSLFMINDSTFNKWGAWIFTWLVKQAFCRFVGILLWAWFSKPSLLLCFYLNVSTACVIWICDLHKMRKKRYFALNSLRASAVAVKIIQQQSRHFRRTFPSSVNYQKIMDLFSEISLFCSSSPLSQLYNYVLAIRLLG